MDDNDFKSTDGDLVLRDDQSDFFVLLDEAKNRRERNARLRLIDSGRYSVLEMERLGLAGADVFTSDNAGRSPADLFILNRAAGKGGGCLAHFHYGPLAAGTAETGLPLAALREAVRDGLDVYLSNKATARDPNDLIALAEDARGGRSRLGYYHHGPLAPGHFELARRGAWIHVAAAPEEESDAVPRLVTLASSAAAAGGGLVVHLERPFSVEACEDLLAANAHLIFRTPPSDYRSPFRRLEEQAARRPLDPRSSYLYCEFMR